jgi:hypothetical protein
VDPGRSSVIAAGGSGRVEASRDPLVWERAGEVRAYLPMGRPFRSRGHFGGRWQVQILVNREAEPVYTTLGPTSVFAAGAVLVKTHADADSGASGPLFARIKREPGFFPDGNDWEYVATDAEGRIEDRGALALCARCHAEALGDATFALPPDARPP